MTQTTSQSPAPEAPSRFGKAPGERINIGVLQHGRRKHPVLGALLGPAATWCHAAPVDATQQNDFGQLRNFDVMLFIDNRAITDLDDRNQVRQAQDTLELMRKRRIGTVVLTDRPWQFSKFDAGVVCIPYDSPFERTEGALRALAHVRPLIRQIDKQYISMQRLGRTLQRRFEETDRELRLASRLQHDFMPHELPQHGPFKFASMFRPCSWVSGDIFDVFRLDETHWGFYLADAVGHGVAAGLLTMYIKHAIRPKRVLENGYELVPPNEVLGHLNALLAAQRLPDSQFITGWYGVLNVETKEVQYAVAGHPPAMLVSPDGKIQELHGEGCVLGIAADETYSNESITLTPGQRLVLYSDGLEPTLILRRPPIPELPEFDPAVIRLLDLPADSFITQLRTLLDDSPGSLAQADDVSVLTLDYLVQG
ncbi:MAG TPA: PP2C family protein-serine/threonine phosphatase [Phycisphaerae bacterium]|nr:PP2C family protein-serine/threonine phosphatase [Phycisphaerae bacterium]HRW55257.1 PP2C family protein-serine/threonine phosphatase [Phycisphaerae bacterium]